MLLSQVRLVVSDMDGTLLNSQDQVSQEFFQHLEQLQKSGIHFAIASGRQYPSIAKKLSSFIDSITIIAENGALIKQGSTELYSNTMGRELVKVMIEHLRKIPNIQIILCGKESAYIETDSKNFTELLSEFYTNYQITNDLYEAIENDILKIAVYHNVSSEKHIFPYVQHLEKDLLIKISGKHWIDFSLPDTHKGKALDLIQKRMGISPSQTMVFGDYLNDLEMMNQSYFSYAMANAHPKLQEVARFKTLDNNSMGVEKVLKQLLSSLETSLST